MFWKVGQYCGPSCWVTLAHGQGLVVLVMVHWQVPGWAAKVLQGRDTTQAKW